MRKLFHNINYNKGKKRMEDKNKEQGQEIEKSN